MLGLLQTITSRSKMIGPPKEAGVQGFRTVCLICWVNSTLALSSLLKNSNDAFFFSFVQIDIAIVMRDIENYVQWIGHFLLLSDTPVNSLVETSTSSKKP